MPAILPDILIDVILSVSQYPGKFQDSCNKIPRNYPSRTAIIQHIFHVG